MTSLDKIRESIDEVVAQLMLSHADQLRNQVSERVRVVLEEDAKQVSSIEQQLKERSEQAQSLEQQLTETRSHLEEKQKHAESIENQIADVRKQAEPLQARVAELEGTLKSETERLTKQTHELEQLLELSQEEVKQLQKAEQEQKDRFAQLEKQIDDLKAEHANAIAAKDREFAEKTADYEQRLENSGKAKSEAVEAKEAEFKGRIAELEQQIEHAHREHDEKLQEKQRELTEQVQVLEELLVQGQQAREQQLESQKADFERQLNEVREQLAERDKLVHAQGGELQNRIVALENDLADSRTQLAKVEDERKVWKQRETELSEHRTQIEARHGEVEARRSELEGMQGLWEQRERELTGQLSGLEKRVTELSAAEQEWLKREAELLGHRDQVLSSSAEASVANGKALQSALEDQERLQTQLDGLLEELGRVREELQRSQEAHFTRERQLEEELASLRNELGSKGGEAPPKVVVSAHVDSAREPVDDAEQIRAAVEEIKGRQSQTEILKALLDGAAQFAARTGIFVVQGKNANGWAGRGFTPESDFRRLSLDCTTGMAGKIVHERTSVHGHAAEFDAKLVRTLGEPGDGKAYIFPLVVRDRVAALFYADCGNVAQHDVSAKSIETLVQAAAAWLNEQAAPKAAPVVPDIPSMKGSGPAAPAKAMAAAAAQSAVATEAAPAAGEATDASRQRARRFAKLLVDEIKLYNKDAVEQGRQHSDLYDRLRDSIDKSRASYDKRWGKTITDVDYFREELIRNLAENNAAVLGGNFR